MPSPRIRPSSTSPASPPESAAASRRRVARSRDLWLSFFQGALDSLMSSDRDEEKEISEDEAETLARSAAKVADAALTKTEERFQGL